MLMSPTVKVLVTGLLPAWIHASVPPATLARVMESAINRTSAFLLILSDNLWHMRFKLYTCVPPFLSVVVIQSGFAAVNHYEGD